MTRDDKVEAWNLIDTLRAPEGHSVTLICDNPDFNGQPNSAVECCGDWTGWDMRRFTGDSVLDALRTARDEMLESERRILYGAPMIELRWVEFGQNKQLEYRTKIYSGRRLDATGKTNDVWSDWVVVPTIGGDEAALGDLIASGGIVNAP